MTPVVAWGVAAWGLALSIAALLVASVTAIAQIALWRREGPRVSVECSNGVPVGMPGPDILAIITATNAGRHATTVQGWGFEVGRVGGPSVVGVRGGWMSPSLPHRLEPHSSVGFQTDLVETLSGVLRHGSARGTALIPFVTLPTGRVRGKAWCPHDDWWTKAASRQ